ncbi:imelysin family protein [Curvivirga sp.]|uniref:imelysin family protein n=1 Tax=Curvivirga sp. TaxID=2856848 RepID=UPI003B5AAA7C
MLKRSVAAVALLSLGACVTSGDKEVTKANVLDTYANIAQAKFEDSLTTAQDLQAAIDALVANPSEETLDAARDAWVAARVPYQQSEVYRFGNAAVDDWEGKVNAWPLDEGLIDYVDAGYGVDSDENALYTANVIASTSLKLGGETVDTSVITKQLLSETLHEIDGVEANVATGYHAIEFLLWGQDLNGTDAGAGDRPYTDFDVANCTGANCDRRVQYLTVSADLLIDDLKDAVAMWSEGGEARVALTSDGEDAGLTKIFTGMGSLSYGELAGERIKLGLMLNDPEEEHDCFSDNTHWSHYYDAKGIQNIYNGSYTRVNGDVISGPSVSDLVKATSADVDAAVQQKLDATMGAMTVMADMAESGMAYDQMLGEGNANGNRIIQDVVDSLVDQTKTFEAAMGTLGLTLPEFEGSDSLDNPSAVFE